MRRTAKHNLKLTAAGVDPLVQNHSFSSQAPARRAMQVSRRPGFFFVSHGTGSEPASFPRSAGDKAVCRSASFGTGAKG